MAGTTKNNINFLIDVYSNFRLLNISEILCKKLETTLCLDEIFFFFLTDRNRLSTKLTLTSDSTVTVNNRIPLQQATASKYFQITACTEAKMMINSIWLYSPWIQLMEILFLINIYLLFILIHHQHIDDMYRHSLLSHIKQ